MTQDYDPIELNENTPEPKENGIYLLTITIGDETRTYPATKEGDMWLTDDDCTWKDLLSEMSQADRVTIQSLTDLRAETWAEGHDRGWMDGVENAEPASPNPYRKENHLYKSNGLQREEQQQ